MGLKVRVRQRVAIFLGRRSQVVKAGVCKTPIHRFESGRRLHPVTSFITRDQVCIVLLPVEAVK